MYTVRCIIDNKIYTADQFQAMSEIERQNFRGKLVCETCNGKAYFRKKRKDGKSACFCGKHIENCDDKSHTRGVAPPDNLEIENILFVRDDQFTLKEKNYIKSMWTNDGNGDIDTDDVESTKEGRQKRTYINNPATQITIHKTLPQILTICINGILEKHNFNIEVYDGFYDHIRKCVHELKCANEKLLGNIGYYWSYIICADSNWLNTNNDYLNNPSFLLNDEIINEFWSSLQIKPSQWDKSVPIIVRGKLQKSLKGKFYVEINDFESIYVHTKIFKKAFEYKITESSTS